MLYNIVPDSTSMQVTIVCLNVRLCSQIASSKYLVWGLEYEEAWSVKPVQSLEDQWEHSAP